MTQVLRADDAVRLIPNGSTVLINPLPIEEVFPAFRRVFEEAGSPKDLTLIFAAGIGPFSDEPRGMNHFAVPGMVKRVIAGHVGLNHALVKLIASDQIEAYNLPQGVMTQLYREVAAKRPGLITRVGLGTFVDPRLEGGKMNARTQTCEDLVEVMEIDGTEFLRYKPFKPDVGIVRGTAADPDGNITCDDEALTMENLEVAMAVKNSGGFVIAQVGGLLDAPASPHSVLVPSVLVDYVVVGEPGKSHPHTLFAPYDPSLSGKERVKLGDIPPLPLNGEKVICRRAAMELARDMMVNLGVGIPMGVAAVAAEEGVIDKLTMSTEIGVFGGRPEGGLNFGPAKNPAAIIPQPSMFDYYDGGGLDMTCVGAAQVDGHGNVNVSKLGPRLIGCGGFIDITQSVRKCVFCGEFTAGGLDTRVGDGCIEIVREGKAKKFVGEVQQITFSGALARRDRREVLYVTERCVFRLGPDGVELLEVAPGIDIERDILAQMDFSPAMPAEVPLMDEAIFRDEPIGLADRVNSDACASVA